MVDRQSLAPETDKKEDGQDVIDHAPFTWADAPTSAEEFDHGNPPGMCDVQRLSTTEWEDGRHWLGDFPVIVENGESHKLLAASPLSLSPELLHWLLMRCVSLQ